jgi:hypothetical protein
MSDTLCYAKKTASAPNTLTKIIKSRPLRVLFASGALLGIKHRSVLLSTISVLAIHEVAACHVFWRLVFNLSG